LLAVNELLAAAAAALGTGLSEPTNLGGSERSAVLRCRASHGGSVVVKNFPRTRQGAESFAAEAAGLAFSGPAGTGPRLLAASQDALLVVMTDLGTAPSLADLLLSGPRQAAEAALLGWARACGRLAVGAAGRELELADLRAKYRGVPAAGSQGHWLERRIAEVPALLGELSIPSPAGLRDDLADVATILRPGRFEVFSPGDICPDNNLLTAAGVRFVDFESAEYHSAFLDAAYLRMPFSTCWCVFRLPGELARSAEAAYRDLVCGIFGDLASDEVWQPGLRRATAAWTLHAMTYLLDRSLVADRPMIDDGRAAPTARQLLRYRWQLLAAELAPSGELPALGALITRLLAGTEHWQSPDLPLYPAFS
jgi:hypothetical protein